MEIKDLTEEIVTPIIRELVAEFGEDYVYKKEEQEADEDVICSYQENGKPSCIVGHVLHRAGVEYNPDWEGGPCGTFLRGEGVPGYLANALGFAQVQQDIGKTWGEALNAYEERVQG